MKTPYLSVPLTAVATLLIATSAFAQDSAKPAPSPKILQTRVWVNNSTRVYHCPGTQYYGKTRNGEFMEEAQARGFGIRAAGGRGCRKAATSGPAPLPDTATAARKMVWLNTESSIYHCPNSADWGATRRGGYLSEADASTAGHKPAAGKKCAP